MLEKVSPKLCRCTPFAFSQGLLPWLCWLSLFASHLPSPPWHAEKGADTIWHRFVVHVIMVWKWIPGTNFWNYSEDPSVRPATLLSAPHTHARMVAKSEVFVVGGQGSNAMQIYAASQQGHRHHRHDHRHRRRLHFKVWSQCLTSTVLFSLSDVRRWTWPEGLKIVNHS